MKSRSSSFPAAADMVLTMTSSQRWLVCCNPGPPDQVSSNFPAHTANSINNRSVSPIPNAYYEMESGHTKCSTRQRFKKQDQESPITVLSEEKGRE